MLAGIPCNGCHNFGNATIIWVIFPCKSWDSSYLKILFNRKPSYIFWWHPNTEWDKKIFTLHIEEFRLRKSLKWFMSKHETGNTIRKNRAGLSIWCFSLGFSDQLSQSLSVCGGPRVWRYPGKCQENLDLKYLDFPPVKLWTWQKVPVL